MKKLALLKNLFNQNSLKVADTQALDPETVRVFAALDQALPTIFPDAKAMEKIIMELPLPGYGEKGYNSSELVFHTSDDAWLAKYIQHNLPKADPKIKLNQIKRYMATSQSFAAARANFNQNIIRGQIIANIKYRIPNGLNQPGLRNLSADKDYDKVMRAKVVDALTNLNLDRHTIEVGIERNANLWFKDAVNRTFFNRYLLLTPAQRKVLAEKNDDEWKHLMNAEHEYNALWTRLREYDYYQDHKDIIDELGTATPNMKMKPAMVKQLRQTAQDYHERYTNYAQSLFGDEKPNPQFNLNGILNFIDNINFFSELDSAKPDLAKVQAAINSTVQPTPDKEI